MRPLQLVLALALVSTSASAAPKTAAKAEVQPIIEADTSPATPERKASSPKKTIVITGAIPVDGHVAVPVALVLPRNKMAKQDVDTTDDHLADAMKRH